jgi:nitrate/nitrite transport system permease protein
MKTITIKTVKFMGLGYLEPLIRLTTGEEVKKKQRRNFQKDTFPTIICFSIYSFMAIVF